ncbi:antirestriction protein ArdA [Gordonia defluvii]|uniref:Antirestriction protein ArdA n=1 Tax=Gordonia defluvii TaxID=283718 RepID=A0ABP6LHN6_9ACTN
MSAIVTANTPRVWAGCESCYSNGRLVGVWVDAIDAADLTAAEIHAGSGIDPAVEGCEEFVCMDTDGLPTTGEPSLEEAARWGEIHAEIGDERWPALCAWVRSGSYVAEGDTAFPVLSDFEDRYCGSGWDSFQDYAEGLAEDIGLLSEVPESLQSCFDMQSWARDLAFDYVTERDTDGTLHIFRSY